MSSSSSCRGVTKQGAPCSVTWGLDPNGFCKFHAPNARQCLGTSRSTGQRCRIKWDLDDSGYCIHHTPYLHSHPQTTTTSSPAIPNVCRGVTKRGTACSVTWGLDADGFCKYHAPNAKQCKGLARASGRRCKIKWGLDEKGYCQFHRRVEAPVTRQCEAVTSNGRRCLQTVGIDADGFCTAHRAVNMELPKCRGVLPGKENCGSNAKKGYDYCCAAHDPKFVSSYVAPSLFNDPGLRSCVEGDIVKLFKGRDLYHGDKLDLNTVGAVELDHILEKQCFAYAFQHVEFQGGEEEKQDVAFMLREEVVNELPNLCLTRSTTNKIKGAAVAKFLDDSLTGHRGSKTFTDYLLEENRDDTRLPRNVTRIIKSEMGSALRRCQRKLADEGETPAFEALSAELQKLYVDMDLHASHSGKTKPRTDATKTVKEDEDDEYVLIDSASTDSWTVVDIQRSVKVETRQPVLSADAKPFVPGLVCLTKTDLHAGAKVEVNHCGLEADEVVSKMPPIVKREATKPSESTSEVVVKNEKEKVQDAKAP